MRVAIIGAGALGCHFGARLSDSGEDVWLIHNREEYVRRVREQGIEVESEVADDRHTHVPITTDAAEVGEVDLVIVFVKAHVTSAALDQHGACIGPDTRVLSLQNGLRHYDRLRDRFGDRALGGYTRQGVTRTGPGTLQHGSDGTSVFGGPDEAFAADIADRFRAAGFPSRVVDDPNPHIWNKQMISLAIKPLAGLTGLRNNRLDRPGLVRIMENIVRESIRVAETRGIELSEEDAMERVLSATETTHKSSMLQDLEAGRRTEIDEINGAIVEYAEATDVDVPYNRVVTELVRAIEPDDGP